MSLLALPVELLDDIAHTLDNPALLALSRTHSLLSPVALRLLYRHLSLSAWSRNLPVVFTLARKHHIAPFVRSFSIVIDPLAPAFPSFYRLLALAILNMSHLTSLRLLVDSSFTCVLQPALARNSYPHLTHFTSSFPFDHHVASFLQKTPALLELEVDSLPARTAPLPSLPPTSIPLLSHFIGSPRSAKLIVPGRPVASIHLNGGSLTDDDVPSLANSSVPLLVLGAVTTLPPVPFLELLHTHMPRLAYLRIMSTQNLFNTPSAAFYEQVANALAAFSDLNAFELSGMHWGSHRKDDDGKKRIWQSAPLAIDINRNDDISDLFFAY